LIKTAGFFAIAGALGVMGCAPERDAPLEPVKIGVLSSTSGALASFGASLQKAVFLAQEQVNAAGGVFDARPLELVVRDTTSDPPTAAAAAAELVDEGVVAMVGPETSGQSDAVLDVAEAAKIPMVSCCATSTELSGRNSGGSGFFFRTAPSDALQGKALAFIAKEGVDDAGLSFPSCRQVAFFNRPDSYGTGFKDVFVANYPASAGAIVASGEFPNGDPVAADIDAASAAFVADITANAAPDEELCIVFITFGFEGARLVGNLERALVTATTTATDPLFGMGYHYLTGDGAQEAAFLQELETAPSSLRDKLIGTVPFHATSPAFDQFATAFTARFGEPPSAYCAQAFDTMFVTALATTKARSTDGEEIRNELFAVSGRDGGVKFEDGNFFGEIAARVLDGDEVDYIGPSGDLTFDAIGDVQGDYVLWQVGEAGEDLKFEDKVPLPVTRFNPL
jgi:ABC-type branched-subunit amino acid transport system substrate-binding protein